MQYVALPGSDHSHETGLSRTFGIAFMITQSSTIWGNLIGSLGICYTQIMYEVSLINFCDIACSALDGSCQYNDRGQ